MRRPPIHLAVSGWYYAHCDKIFFPKNVKPHVRLHYYGAHFPITEVHNIFSEFQAYQLNLQ